MDGSHFDTVAKSLAAPGSRRQALGGLLGASLALLRFVDGSGDTGIWQRAIVVTARL